MAQETVTLHATSRNTTDYSYASISGGDNPIGKTSSNTTYATINLKTGSRATTYVYYNIDCSDIPANATIDSVTAKAKCYISSTTSSYISTRQIQLYSGSTAKGSASTVSTSTTAFNMTPGTWTRAELDNCRVRIYGVRGTSSTSTTRYFRFYGIDLTIKYTYNSEQLMIKTNGNWNTTVSKVYKKVNNVWVEQTDLKSLFNTDTIYKKEEV